MRTRTEGTSISAYDAMPAANEKAHDASSVARYAACTGATRLETAA
jgi:hypothetical protein